MRRRGFLQGIGFGGIAWALRPEPGVSPRAALAAREPRRSLAASLSDGGVTLGLRLTRFDQSNVAATSDVQMPAPSGSAKLVLGDTTVSCRSRVVPARDRPDATDIEVSFKVLRGRLPNASLAVTLSIGRWSRDAYLLIPGAVYAGNRFASRHISFPPLLSEPSDIGPHVPAILTDVPRLNNQPGESSIALGAADVAVPTIGIRLPGAGPDSGFGLLVLAEPATSIGQVGLLVVENADRSAATLSICAPSVRPGVRYALCNGRAPSNDRGADLDMGTSVTLRLRVWGFACPDVKTLFDRWFDSRRDRVGPVKLPHDVPLSTGRHLIEEHLMRDQWADVPGVFATRPPTAVNGPTGGTRIESTFWTGADGALALALPTMASGAGDARKRAAAILDFQFRGQAPSGFFHAVSTGSVWWDEGQGPPDGQGTPGERGAGGRGPVGMGRGSRGRRWTHVGRNAEAMYMACKQILLLERIEPTFRLPDPWRTGLARAADGFVRLWNRYEQLGQYLNADTGDIAVGGSTAGALAPAALARAARILDQEVYLRTAIAVADALYARFVKSGLTLGGAPAALQCPDSRSASGLLESFVTLAETTGDSMWFDRAAEAAHQLASWIVAWDVALPPSSTLGKLGARTTGAVLSSAQDKWALPGFAGLSGDAFFRLYRATGRTAYLELLRETVRNSTGYIATADRQAGAETPPGWVAGRIAIGDASGSPGEVPGATPAGTAQASCLLIATEIPSIYIQPDTGFVFAFDHVEARVTQRTVAHTRISVHNPTRFEAEVRILSELDRHRMTPLDPFPLWGARTLTLGAGATDEIEFARPSS